MRAIVSLMAPIKLSTGFMYKHFIRLVFGLESQTCVKQMKNVLRKIHLMICDEIDCVALSDDGWL